MATCHVRIGRSPVITFLSGLTWSCFRIGKAVGGQPTLKLEPLSDMRSIIYDSERRRTRGRRRKRRKRKRRGEEEEKEKEEEEGKEKKESEGREREGRGGRGMDLEVSGVDSLSPHRSLWQGA